ncbi:MAG TPA: 50S ribosomal protein L10 [Planctomycetota bacterium]|nr:50S ribosomal protein L10 [Planctomycetota bacterium]
MSKTLNAAMIDALATELGSHDSCVLIGCEAFTVDETVALRKKLREKNFRMRVVKNTLAVIAFDKAGMKGLGARLSGPSAVVFGGEGAGAIAKVLVPELSAGKKKLKIHGGYSEGEVLDPAGIDSLSKAPGRTELLAMTLAGISGPLSGMAGAMDGLFTEMHGLIEALVAKNEGNAQS